MLSAIWVVYDLQQHRNKYINDHPGQHPQLTIKGVAALSRIAGPVATQVIGMLPPALAPPLFITCWLIVR